jgi:hypothetical protein
VSGLFASDTIIASYLKGLRLSFSPTTRHGISTSATQGKSGSLHLEGRLDSEIPKTGPQEGTLMPAFFGALVFPSRLFRLRGYIKQRTSISFRISYLYLYYFHAQFAESVLILFLILIQFPLCLISSQSFRPLHYWHAFHICFNLMLLE